ncbi:MAG: Na(+)-translocating NADH-quinone reductase subunit C [Woeseiaceae bacterium]|nr:Na(+)-translocating NADH-quinone reductase subunit C [Woeseiaceae bacterium]
MSDADNNANEEREAFDRDSTSNTLTIAIGLSLVCSILVAGAAIMLKPIQEMNEVRFRQRIILDVAGLLEPGADIEQGLERIEARVVELETGEYVESIDANNFDPIAAANEPDTSVRIPEELDIGKIKRRAIYAPVYLVSDGGELSQIILPVRGTGLWSTLYGYLALEPDGETVSGLQFYDHAETPGLGDQIEDPEWQAQWVGKKIYGDDGQPRMEVVRGTVADGNPYVQHQVDGLSGATLTGRGVMNLVRYWTGPHGYGPYLEQYRQAKGT